MESPNMINVFNDSEESEEDPSGERWPPLGASDVDRDKIHHFPCDIEDDRLKDLEHQQELLNSSLIALTTHFAQVQFRLKQIVDAPAQDKEKLLKDLEEFAFRGIPEIPDILTSPTKSRARDFESVISVQKMKQKDLIIQLKGQLEELERYAYDMGDADLPQSVLLEKQKIIIDELKGKINLNVEHIDRLTLEDIRIQVDQAVSQLVNPLKVKEQLVIQLKTQIGDLERFITFLQGESQDGKPEEQKCNCPVHPKVQSNAYSGRRVLETNGEVRDKVLHMIRRAGTLLQLFALSQFGCGSSRNFGVLKRTMKSHHWGDLRARLELAVVNVLALASESPSYDENSSDSEYMDLELEMKIATTVRKQLAVAIRDLMQHGLISVELNTSLVPFFACFPHKEAQVPYMHAWELILQYYEIKNGALFNATPMRRLSESFNLNIVGSTSISTKHSLLSAVGKILTMHSKFKRSYDAQFKAFVCCALNCRKLVVWLRLIFRCQNLIESFYEPWSYVAKTGFEDSLQSLDKLTFIKFNLPVDTAVNHFRNIKDAF